MLISVHVPKCAGTSFRHVLQALYGDGLWSNYGAIFTRANAKTGIVPHHTRCIHGHFFADAFDELYPQGRLITWVRDPVDRVVSNYYHFLRNPDMRDGCCRALFEQRLSLRRFAEMDWMRNEATRYLAAKPVEDFAFVGIAERFTESLSVFGPTFGWSPHLPSPRVNVNPVRRDEHYSLSPDDQAYLRSLNSRDLAWYQQANARLDHALLEMAQRAA
jgi:hypothetical protein